MIDNFVVLQNDGVLSRPSSRPATHALVCQELICCGELLGDSLLMQQLRSLLRKVAHTDATVLLRGESGTGKVFLAGQIVREGTRAGAPLVHVDCAGFPEHELESLFGLETLNEPATQNCFQLAQGGTLLLEEIGALSLTAQAKLLQVLQTQLLEAGNGNRPTQLDVRLIATSNRPLETKVQRGEFREDLLNALSIMPITAPPLRERREDIPILADHFRQSMSRKYGLEVLAMAPACVEALQKYAWPGNVRELQLVLEQAVLACGGGVLEPQHLNSLFDTGAPSVAAEVQSEIEDLGELEKQHIFTVLKRCDDNRTHAAKRLGISVRTLRNKLREYREAAAAAAAAPQQPVS